MNKPSRRAVVRTGVWAVPVVATAAAAPAFAGTETPPVTIDSVGSGCKLPGHSTHNGETFYGYRMVLTFQNNTATQQDVTLLDFTISGKATTGFPVGSHLFLDPGDTPELFIVTSSASSQRTATITYSVNSQIITQTVTFPDFNPCQCDPRDADPQDPASNCS
jgi:hypothetical protein